MFLYSLSKEIPLQTGQGRAYIVKGELKLEVDEKLDVSNLDQNEHIILSGYLVPDPVLGSGYILMIKKISSLSLWRLFPGFFNEYGGSVVGSVLTDPLLREDTEAVLVKGLDETVLERSAHTPNDGICCIRVG